MAAHTHLTEPLNSGCMYFGSEDAGVVVDSAVCILMDALPTLQQVQIFTRKKQRKQSNKDAD